MEIVLNNEDLLGEIFKFMSTYHLSKIPTVNKTWNKVMKDIVNDREVHVLDYKYYVKDSQYYTRIESEFVGGYLKFCYYTFFIDDKYFCYISDSFLSKIELFLLGTGKDFLFGISDVGCYRYSFDYNMQEIDYNEYKVSFNDEFLVQLKEFNETVDNFIDFYYNLKLEDKDRLINFQDYATMKESKRKKRFYLPWFYYKLI